MPARVVLQDFTGVPCVVDLAAMRDAMARMKGDPDRINPVVPCDLVIDHSVQVDYYGSERAFQLNVELEFERNVERYQLLKFAQRAFRQLPGRAARHRDRPPGEPRVPGAGGAAAGAVRRAHRLSRHAGRHRLAHHHDQRARRDGLGRRRDRGRSGDAGAALLHAHPRGRRDEAHRASCRSGTTATDLVLTVTQMLRKKGVVDKFVEFYGPGLSQPRPGGPGHHREHGARSTGPRWASSRWTPRRSATWSAPAGAATRSTRVERYCKEQGLFRTDATPGSRVHRHARARPRQRRRRASPARSVRRTGCRSTELKRNFVVNLPGLMSPDGAGGAARSWRESAYSRWVGEGGANVTIGGHGAEAVDTALDPDAPPVVSGVLDGARHLPARRCRRHRRDHQLHQHLQSVGDDRRGTGGEEGGGARAGDSAVGEDAAWRRAPGW